MAAEGAFLFAYSLTATQLLLKHWNSVREIWYKGNKHADILCETTICKFRIKNMAMARNFVVVSNKFTSNEILIYSSRNVHRKVL
jgi:hypothetical protein